MFSPKIFSASLAVLLFPSLTVSRAANPWPDAQYLYRQYGTSTTGMNARVFKPLSYDANSSAKHPVVIFFHGDGQIENNFTFGNPNVGNSLQMSDHGQYVFVTSASQAIFPCFFVLAQRQGPNRPGSLDDGAMAIIDGIEAEFKTTGGVSKVDRDRLHLTGLSGGGGASVIIAGQRPGVFASGVFVCPTIPPSPWWVPANMSGVNTWFFHAIGDTTVTWRCSQVMVNDLRALGNRPIFTRYGNPDFDPSNEGSHGIWGQSYATPYLIPWMAAQRRGIPSGVDPATVDFVLPSGNSQYTSPIVSMNFSGTTGQLTAANPAINGVWFSRNDFVDIHRPSGDSIANYQPAGGTIQNWNFSNGEPVNQWNTNPMKFYVVATGTSWNAALGGVTYYSDTILVTKPTSGSTDSTFPTISFLSPTTGTTHTTQEASVTVMGTSADNAGVAHVGWTNSKGGSGFAQGTLSWSSVVPVQTGTNVVAFKAYDTAGNATTRTLTIIRDSAPAPTPTPPVNGHGLRAMYYDNMDFTGTSVARIDANVNFAWGAGSPDSSIAVDTFSARWEGEVEIGVSGTYTFSISSDDGSRLWIGNTKVADHWGDHGYSLRSGSIVLTGGQRYPIKVEYYDNGYDATMELRWTPPSGTSVIVPSSALYPPVAQGLVGTYYDNVDFTGASFSRVDPTISFYWDIGSPDSRIASETFSVRWEGQIQAPMSGVYTFSVGSDDGSRLWVGGAMVADNWGDHGHTVRTGTVALVAGQKYPIKLEYYEKSSGASAELKWTRPGGTSEIIPSSVLFAVGPNEVSPLKLRYDFGGTVDQTTDTGWNNVTNFSVGTGVANSVDTRGVPTGVGLSITKAFNGVNAQGSDSTSGVYPAAAMKDTIFTNAGVVGKLQLTGLEPGAGYTLTFFGSRVVTPSEGRVTKYTVGSSSVTLDAAQGGGNVTATAKLPEVAANSSGVIDIEVTNDTGSTFGYLGVLEVEKKITEPQVAAAIETPTAPAGLAPVLTSAVSRLSHGAAGAFDIKFPLAGAPGVECRQTPSGTCIVEFEFSKPITGGVVSLIGIGSVSGPPVVSGNKMTVNLSGVADGQTLSLSIGNVAAADGSAAGSASLTFRVLQGDVSGDGAVTDTDVQLVKGKISPAINVTNAPCDINRSGTLNTTDVVVISSRLGRSAL